MDDASGGLIKNDEEIVAADNDDLDIAYGSSDDINNVTTNLILVTEGTYGSTITWSSSHPDIIANDGTVTRPAYGSGDATVILTATITKGSISETKTFTLIVKQTPPTDAEAVAADKASLAIGYSGSDSYISVTQNVTLPTSGSSGTTITWGTSNSSVVTIDGTVTCPAFSLGDSTVTLTATISKGGVSDTKTFILTVKKAPQTDSEAVAADKASLEIGYLGSDSAGSVTQNVTLLTTGSSGTAITWSSDNLGVITTGGVVTRPAFGSVNAIVTLTATVDKGLESEDKVFTLTVKAVNFATVTYHANGGTLGTVPVDASNYQFEAAVIVLGNTGDLAGPLVLGAHTGSGIRQRFMGWNTDPSATTTQYSAGHIFNITENTTLYAIYTTGTNALRKVGPAGGWVFYDEGSVKDWGRYLEAAPSDLGIGIQWYNGIYINTGATGIRVGKGLENTNTIMTKQGETYTNYGAGLARSYMGGGFTDWYLPSKDELNRMYVNLHQNGVGDFIGGAWGKYWSSSESIDHPTYAWLQYFSSGEQFIGRKFETYRIRPIRAF